MKRSKLNKYIIGITLFPFLLIILCMGVLSFSGCKTVDDYNRGVTYHKEGQLDQAIFEYSKAIEVNPRFVEAYFNRGFAYLNNGQYEHAISDFNKVIEINPKHSKAYDDREYTRMIINVEKYATLLKKKGRDTEAKLMEERAEILLKSYKSPESSSYLGFVPSKVLREYALLLGQEGDKNKAEEINSLADWWDQANLKAAEQTFEKGKKQKVKEPEELITGKTYIKIQVSQGVRLGGKLQFEAKPGDVLEVIRSQTCRSGRGECWVVKNIKTGETGIVRAALMKNRHYVFIQK